MNEQIQAEVEELEGPVAEGRARPNADAEEELEMEVEADRNEDEEQISEFERTMKEVGSCRFLHLLDLLKP
jgi:hypothetical protein